MSETLLTEYETMMLALFQEIYNPLADAAGVAQWDDLYPPMRQALTEAVTNVIIQVESDMY